MCTWFFNLGSAAVFIATYTLSISVFMTVNASEALYRKTRWATTRVQIVVHNITKANGHGSIYSFHLRWLPVCLTVRVIIRLLSVRDGSVLLGLIHTVLQSGSFFVKAFISEIVNSWYYSVSRYVSVHFFWTETKLHTFKLGEYIIWM